MLYKKLFLFSLMLPIFSSAVVGLSSAKQIGATHKEVIQKSETKTVITKRVEIIDEETTEQTYLFSSEGLQQEVYAQNTLDSLNCGQEKSPYQIMHQISQTINQDDQEFLCKTNNHIQEVNQQTFQDREMMLDYLEKSKKSPEAVSENEHIKMIQLMMKYRIFQNKVTKKPYFFSSIRYGIPTGIDRKTYEVAKQYYKKHGAPKACLVYSGNSKSAKDIDSDDCEETIKSRAQLMPSSIILTQATIESDWGSSNLATSENNILGLQVLFSNSDSMLKPPFNKHCRPARQAPNRCLVRFANQKGSIHEYFYRMNGTPYSSYQNYRKNREDIYSKYKKNSSELDFYSQLMNDDNCSISKELTNSMDFYAEDKNYIPKLQEKLKTVCEVLKKCPKSIGI